MKGERSARRKRMHENKSKIGLENMGHGENEDISRWWRKSKKAEKEERGEMDKSVNKLTKRSGSGSLRRHIFLDFHSGLLFKRRDVK